MRILWSFRFVLMIFMFMAWFEDLLDKYTEIPLTLLVWPAYFLSLIVGANNVLIKEVDCYVFLTPIGVGIFYGGLLFLTFIVPFFFKRF